jgi:hypothetical protein
MPKRKQNPGLGTWLAIALGAIVAGAVAVGAVRKKKSKTSPLKPVPEFEVVEEGETFLKGRSVKYKIKKKGSEYSYSVFHNPMPGEEYSYSFGQTGFATSRDEAFYKILDAIPFASFLPQDRTPDSVYVKMGATEIVQAPSGGTFELSYDASHLNVGLSDDPQLGRVAMVEPLTVGILPVRLTVVYLEGRTSVYKLYVVGMPA